MIHKSILPKIKSIFSLILLITGFIRAYGGWEADRSFEDNELDGGGFWGTGIDMWPSTRMVGISRVEFLAIHITDAFIQALVPGACPCIISANYETCSFNQIPSNEGKYGMIIYIYIIHLIPRIRSGLHSTQ